MELQMWPCNCQLSFQLWAVLTSPRAEGGLLGCAEEKGGKGVYLTSG